MEKADHQMQTDREVCQLARSYLLSLDGITPEMVDKYLSLSESRGRPQTLPGIYKKLVFHAQNRQMMPRVIGGAIGGVISLNATLFGFQPASVLEQYDGWERLLDEITRSLLPDRPPRRKRGSLWPLFCRSVISGARFLNRFKDAGEFYAWVDAYDRDDDKRILLPKLLKAELFGFGFALACDFLKELGYVNFGKPDVHLKKIFVSLGLCLSAKDEDVFHAIARVARNVGVTPYYVDKLFWLIGSGNFYLDGLRFGSRRNDFIKFAKERLATGQKTSKGVVN